MTENSEPALAGYQEFRSYIKMKNLINKLGIGALGLILAGSLNGCGPNYSEREQSEVLYEKGKVITTLYNKKHSDSNMGVGITTGGDLAVTSTSITIPESWGVVFRCEHGNKFPIMGKDEKYKKLWKKLDEGDSVRISYKENYEVKYNRKTKMAVSKELIDYDFIDAEKIKGDK